MLLLRTPAYRGPHYATPHLGGGAEDDEEGGSGNGGGVAAGMVPKLARFARRRVARPLPLRPAQKIPTPPVPVNVVAFSGVARLGHLKLTGDLEVEELGKALALLLDETSAMITNVKG